MAPGSVRYFGRKLTLKAIDIVSNCGEVVCFPLRKVARDRHRPSDINLIGVYPALSAVKQPVTDYGRVAVGVPSDSDALRRGNGSRGDRALQGKSANGRGECS